jgi:hypothetical protein
VNVGKWFYPRSNCTNFESDNLRCAPGSEIFPMLNQDETLVNSAEVQIAIDGLKCPSTHAL